MKYFFLFLLLIVSKFTIGQLQMKIKHLYVKNVIHKPEVKNWNFHKFGPILEFVCLIENKSDSVFMFPVWDGPEQEKQVGEVICNFSYRGKKYMELTGCGMFDQFSGVIDKDTLDILPFQIPILPHQSIEIWTCADFFLRTPIWSLDKNDYTRELLEILPTLKVRYETPKFTLFTTEIMNVYVDYNVKDE